MRVTENTNFDTIRDGISRAKERMENLQFQSATLKKLNTPSDNPVGAAKVLEVRTEKVNNEQYQSNSKMAQTFLENSDHALSELSEILVRAKEIALGQASGASSNDDSRLGVAEEVTQLFEQAVSVANRRVGDRYLFGGFKTQSAPVDAEGRFKGDNGQMMVEVAKDVFITTNLPGNEVFNTNARKLQDGKDVYAPRKDEDSDDDKKPAHPVDTRAPASEHDTAAPTANRDSGEASLENINIFDELQSLRIALLTGDIDGIRSTLERFDQINAHVVAERSKVGSRIQGIESTESALERHNLTNAALTSSIEDADMAQVVSDLAKEETVYRSALASSKKLVQPTLLDFLK